MLEFLALPIAWKQLYVKWFWYKQASARSFLMLAIFYWKCSDANDGLDSVKDYIDDAGTRQSQLHLIVKCLKYLF